MTLIRKILLNTFSHQTLFLIRWDIHFIFLRFNNLLFFKKRKLLKILSKKKSPLFLNLGSGKSGKKSDNWINIDGFKGKHVDYCLDFNKTLPFKNNTFDGIFCEHVLEHFNLEIGLKLLKECFRIMRPGGSLRIIVPDGEKIIKTYFNNPSELQKKRSVDSNCAMEAVNSYFRQRYEHQITYDEKLLTHQVTLAGFNKIFRVNFGKGMFSLDIILDNDKYEWESLYIEAAK